MRKVKQLLPSFGLSLNKGYIAPWQTSCYQYHYAFPGMHSSGQFNLSLRLGSLAFLTGDQNAKFFRHMLVKVSSSSPSNPFRAGRVKQRQGEGATLYQFSCTQKIQHFSTSSRTQVHAVLFTVQAFTCKLLHVRDRQVTMKK